jgi:hypothetical protein
MCDGVAIIFSVTRHSFFGRMRFVSALFLWAFGEAAGNDGLCP